MPAKTVGEEIKHLIKDKGMKQKQAVAVALSMQREGDITEDKPKKEKKKKKNKKIKKSFIPFFEDGMFLIKSRPHEYIRKEGKRYIYKEPQEKKDKTVRDVVRVNEKLVTEFKELDKKRKIGKPYNEQRWRELKTAIKKNRQRLYENENTPDGYIKKQN